MGFKVAAGLVMASLAFLLLPDVLLAATPTKILLPNYEPQSIYARAWKNNNIQFNRLSSPRGLIVNHHLLAADIMAKTFAAASSSRVRTIYIISPDHFLNGRRVISTSSSAWNTPWGDVAPDYQAIAGLRTEVGAINEVGSLATEHGIFNLLPMVQRYFPQAVVIPIVIKATASDDWLARLTDYLSNRMNYSTMLIGSFDFSHGHTLDVADAHDEVSLRVIRNMDASQANHVDVDSPEGLSVILKVMSRTGSKLFELTAHDNSARIVNKPQLANTTSYITGVFR